VSITTELSSLRSLRKKQLELRLRSSFNRVRVIIHLSKAKVPDSYLRLLSGAVFDSSKKISTATVEKCVRIIASQQSEVFHAKLYPNKHDEVDYKLFQEEMKEIVCWQVTKNVWVYVVAPFVLPQMDVESERMRIVIVKQS